MSDYLIENSSLKQIRKSIVSSLVGQLGSQSFNFALGLMLLTKTGSSLSFAASQVIGPIISLLFVPIVGPTVDRLSKKQVIAVSQIATIIGLIGYALSLRYFAFNILPPTLILITILAVSDQFTLTAYNAGAKGLVLDAHIQRHSQACHGGRSGRTDADHQGYAGRVTEAADGPSA